jgi:hypothetical protein
MRADPDNLACVRDPALERLLIHTATFADGWRSRGGGISLAVSTDRIGWRDGVLHRPAVRRLGGRDVAGPRSTAPNRLPA